MKINLKINGHVISASLADNATAREFAAMLPMTLTMHDLFGREKFGALPGPLSCQGTRTAVCAVGDLVCWTAGPDLTVFHRPDERPVSGGFQFLGRIDAGAETFSVPGALEVTVERAASVAHSFQLKPAADAAQSA